MRFRVHLAATPSSSPPSSPSSPAVALDARHFSLDFLPDSGGAHWELADSWGGILLFLKERKDAPPSLLAYPPDLVVCDPLARRRSAVTVPAKFRGCYCLGAFLLDGEADEAGGRIGLSNFRVLYALYCEGFAGTLVFSSRSSVDGDGWTLVHSTAHSGMREIPLLTSIHYAGHGSGSIYWMMTADRSFLVLDKDTAEFPLSCFPEDMCNVPDKASRIRVVGGKDGAAVHIAVLTKYFLEVFVQAEDSGKWVSKTRFSLSQAVRELFGGKIKKPHIAVDKLEEIVWVAEGSVVLGAEDEGLISMDLATTEAKRVHERGKHHGPVYKYQLPWPPTIRACLPL